MYLIRTFTQVISGSSKVVEVSQTYWKKKKNSIKMGKINERCFGNELVTLFPRSGGPLPRWRIYVDNYGFAHGAEKLIKKLFVSKGEAVSNFPEISFFKNSFWQISMLKFKSTHKRHCLAALLQATNSDVFCNQRNLEIFWDVESVLRTVYCVICMQQLVNETSLPCTGIIS